MSLAQPPTLSIITPSYNQGPFIAATIDSVLSQEGDFHLDYLVMDGGSADNSPAIIQRYDEDLKSGRIKPRCRSITYRWCSQRDGGQVDAIEKGFALATGQIAAWLNSDDIYPHAQVLSKVVSEFAQDPDLQVLTADGLLIDRQGHEFGVHHVDRLDFVELLYLDYHILQPATFLRDSVYQNERLDRSYSYCFDSEYFIRLIDKKYRLKKLDDRLACFRIYPEIKTLSGLEKRYRESLRISRKYDHTYLKLWRLSVSAIYKYWDIVLRNRYSKYPQVEKGYRRIQPFAYQMILGRAGR